MKEENTLNPDIGSEESSSVTTWIIVGVVLIVAIIGVPALINMFM